MLFKVYTTESIGAPRNHIAIYIETAPSEDAGGSTMLLGQSSTYVPPSMKQIGTIEEEDLDKFIKEVCLVVPPREPKSRLEAPACTPTFRFTAVGIG
ncbi:unnamed protein product [Penicillium salamii]|nr:unnamed protein product [Penicillium salamii]